MCEIRDKVFLITGAAGGIGAGIARAVLEKGAKHVAILDINGKDGKALEAELNRKHGANKAKFHKCDVTTKELDEAFDSTAKEFRYIDVMINNAGIMHDSPKIYVKALEVNVTALIRGSLKAFHLMRKDNGGKGGTIINISSILALMQTPLIPIYSAAKSAVLQFSNCLGAELNYNRTGVRVIALCFGTTETNLITAISAIEPTMEDMIPPALKEMPKQGVDDAVKGVLEAFDKSCSGGTWLITSRRPAEDITEIVKESHAALSKNVMH
ncbi:unnamed protein product [Leptosia nina]|uniref:Alcohol dehydrogenase n=1 Tax=Leptosia nina TaxID=320188 RepID=A0AAV1K645_9NEOP